MRPAKLGCSRPQAEEGRTGRTEGGRLRLGLVRRKVCYQFVVAGPGLVGVQWREGRVRGRSLRRRDH